MPTVVRKPMCTMFKRSKLEKRMYESAKEIDSMRQELEQMREMINQMRSEQTISENENN